MGKHLPRKPMIPIVFVFKSIETEYLEKCVVVEDTDMCSIRHDVVWLLRCWWRVIQELCRCYQTQLNM